MEERNKKETSINLETARNFSYPKNTTKKLLWRDGFSWLVPVLLVAAFGMYLLYGSYKAQKQYYDIFIGAPNIDFNTGKRLENQPPPPPFEYSVVESGILPEIIIINSVALLFLVMAVISFVKAAKTVETAEMRVIDAQRAAIDNLPEVKSYARQRWILALTPFALMIPIPFIAIYKLGIYVFLVYIIFVAVVVGAINVILPRRMSK